MVLRQRPAAEQVNLLSKTWNALAPQWIDWARTPNHDSYWRFHRHAFFEMVPSPGRLTIDLGCGEGRVTRDLVDRGHRVVGVDISPAMSQSAATHPGMPVTAVVGDAARMPIKDGHADLVVAFMSLQDMDDIVRAIAEAARVLTPGGRLVIAIVHPTYSSGTFPGRRNRSANLVMIRPYFDSEICKSIDTRDGLTMTFYRKHRPLGAYTDALAEAGFFIERLNEVTDPDTANPRSRVPMFLDISAILGVPAVPVSHPPATNDPRDQRVASDRRNRPRGLGISGTPALHVLMTGFRQLMLFIFLAVVTLAGHKPGH